MMRPALLAGAAGALVATAAQAADPVDGFALVDPAAVCHTDGTGRLVAPTSSVVDAILADRAVVLTSQYVASASSLFAHSFPPSRCASGDNLCKARNALGRTAHQMLQTRSARRMTLAWVGADHEPADPPGQVDRFLDPQAPGYVLVCDSSVIPRPTPPPRGPGIFEGWVVAQDLASADTPAEQRAPAQISYASDRTNHSSQFSLKGVVLAPNLIKQVDHSTDWSGFTSLSPYVSIDREGSGDPTTAVDDLAIGLRVSGRLKLIQPYFAGSWTTDSEGFNSSLVRFELGVPVDFGNQGFLNGAIDPDGRLTVLFRPTANLVADYADVTDPGTKASLLTTPSYARVGYDLNATIRIGRSKDASSLWLTASYKQRFDYSGHGQADVHLLDLGAEFRPGESSHFSLNLTYERGRTLDSLAPVDTLSVGVGVKY